MSFSYICMLQVTDSSGFPLLDVWLKRSCFRSTWILEAYGDTVLRMENTAKSWRARKTDPSTLAVINSEEETLGFFVVGRSRIEEQHYLRTDFRRSILDPQHGQGADSAVHGVRHRERKVSVHSA